MPVSAPQVELAHGRSDRYRSLGAFGRPAYQSHVQLRAMLQAQGLPRLANYFAKPTLDPASGVMRWSTESLAPVRRLNELGPDQRAAALSVLGDMGVQLRALTQRLRDQGDSQPGGSSAFASLLEQAMRVPAHGEFVYLVGDQPVITFWGFEDLSLGSVDPAAGSREPAAASVVPPPLAADHRSAPAVNGATAHVEPMPWLRRWWWLLALALLVMLSWALRGCLLLSAPGIEESPVTRGLQAVEPLQIPPGALQRGDLSFLKGDWQLGEDRLTTYSGSTDNITGSMREILRFAADGHGSHHGVERLKDDRRISDCHGTVHARTDGIKLFLDLSACVPEPGSGEASLGAHRSECEVESDGKTVCYTVNDDGVRWNAPLRRLSAAGA